MAIDDKDRDVYAAAGMALKWAQLFEAEIITVALSHGIARKKFKNHEEAERFLFTSEKKPLRKLLSEVLSRVKFTPDLTDTFDAAIEARNEFVHRFFWNYGTLLIDDDNRKEIIAQLNTYKNLFFTAHKFASAISILYARQASINLPSHRSSKRA